MRKTYRMVRGYSWGPATPEIKKEAEKTARKLGYTVRKVRTKSRGSGRWQYHWRLFKEAP